MYCVESLLRILPFLDTFLQHELSCDGTLNSNVINQHIPLNNGLKLALLQICLMLIIVPLSGVGASEN